MANDDRRAHPEEETLELYAMGRLEEPWLGELEEHLLLCAGCQDRLDKAAEYVSLLREAAENVAAEAPAEAWWKKWLRLDWMPMQAPALAGALVVLIVAGIWQPWRTAAPAEWRTVELETVRGGADGAAGMEGFALHLRLDVTGIDTAGATAQIVAADGGAVVELPVALVDGKAEIRYGAGLKAGQYWVRLRNSGETAREYSLVVRAR